MVEPPRRTFLKKGLFGGLLLAIGGGAAIALRRPRIGPDGAPRGPLRVFAPEEYAIFAAIAERVVHVEKGLPTPGDLDVAARADSALALAFPSVQKEFRQLLRLFDNGVMGVTTGTGLSPFTASSRAARDARLLAWETSRVPLLRTGFQAIKRLAAACYYSHPSSWGAIGYPGPPQILQPASA